MNINLDRLIDFYCNWRWYPKGLPFNVYLSLHGAYKVPRRVFKSGLDGYFIISCNYSVIHLLNPNLNLYKREEEFKKKLIDSLPSVGESNTLYINTDPNFESVLIDNHLFTLKNNYYYNNGWFQELVKV